MRPAFGAPPARHTQIIVAFLLLAWPLALWMFTHTRPPWGDEAHFLVAVRLFGEGLSLELLRTYPEMATPLSFVAYACWGGIVGFDTGMLRLLSPLVAFATTWIWWLVLCRACGGASRWTLVALAVIVFNPYFVGLSIFVFTDMLALFGLAVVTYGMLINRVVLVVVGIAVATLSRQYLAFLAPAVIAADLLTTAAGRRRGRLSLAGVVGLLPLGACVALWGWQLAPASPLRDLFLTEGLRFDPHALSLYLAVPGIYLLPMLLPVFRTVRAHTWLIAVAVGAFVLVFPVEGSIVQSRSGPGTVGFVHETLTPALPTPAVNAVFWIFATIWLTAAIHALRTLRQRMGAPPLTVADAFPWYGCAMFLLLMPFSYMPWEKYALPLLMLGSLAIAARARDHGPRSPA